MDLFKTGFVYHCQVQFGDTNSAIAAVDCLDDSVSEIDCVQLAAWHLSFNVVYVGVQRKENKR